MINADLLLETLQWVLIGVGAAICIGCVLFWIFPGEARSFVYNYPDGRTVEANYSGGENVISSVTSLLMGFGIGLMTMAVGAMLFCLRRIGSFMGQLRDEMRQIRKGEL